MIWLQLLYMYKMIIKTIGDLDKHTIKINCRLLCLIRKYCSYIMFYRIYTSNLIFRETNTTDYIYKATWSHYVVQVGLLS